jgi:hypothetical protein
MQFAVPSIKSPIYTHTNAYTHYIHACVYCISYLHTRAYDRIHRCVCVTASVWVHARKHADGRATCTSCGHRARISSSTSTSWLVYEMYACAAQVYLYMLYMKRSVQGINTDTYMHVHRVQVRKPNFHVLHVCRTKQQQLQFDKNTPKQSECGMKDEHTCTRKPALLL